MTPARPEPTVASVILEARSRAYHESFVVVAGRCIQAPNSLVVRIVSSITLAITILTALQFGNSMLVPVATQVVHFCIYSSRCLAYNPHMEYKCIFTMPIHNHQIEIDLDIISSSYNCLYLELEHGTITELITNSRPHKRTSSSRSDRRRISTWPLPHIISHTLGF